jgi:hypothetical protein
MARGKGTLKIRGFCLWIGYGNLILSVVFVGGFVGFDRVPKIWCCKFRCWTYWVHLMANTGI